MSATPAVASAWRHASAHSTRKLPGLLWRRQRAPARGQHELALRFQGGRGQPPAPPARACLDEAGIALESVDELAIGWDFSRTPLAGSRRFTDDGLRRLLFPDAEPAQMPRVRWVPHHYAHAASTYFSSGEDEAAILVVDGAGETQATTLASGRGVEIEILREWPMSQSLGFFYASASKWAGFGEWGGGKLMGLAAYGRPQPGVPVRRTHDGYELVLNGAAAAPTNGGAARAPMMSFPPEYEAAVKAAFTDHFPYAEREGEDAVANPDYWALIDSFRRLTGVPAVVNTSFNLAGEPIVHSAADAVSTFVRGEGLDLLVLDGFLAARSESELPS